MFGNKKISFGKININLDKSRSTNYHNDSENQSCKIPEDQSLPTTSGFGKFEAKLKDVPAVETEIAETMGFSSFGKEKFDIEKIIEESKKIAQERNRDGLEKLALDPEIGNQAVEDGDSDDEEMIGPPLPPTLNEASDNDEEDTLALPISQELILRHGAKTVSALAADPSGSRLVSGAMDYQVKYWDFQGMDLSKESFRTFKPSDGYPINSIDYSCSGDKVLVVSGSAQAKVYNRDGVEVYECIKGDMYLHDMAKSKGHISSLTDGKWHPKNKEEFLTAARDGTCRLWYTSRPLQQVHVIKPRTSNGLKAHPISCSFSRDGNVVACAASDGSIQMWDHRKHFVNTCIHIRKAHENGSEISSIAFSYDGKNLASRSSDETLKLWDLRNNKSPILAKTDLFSRFSATDCLFSPNDKLIVTASSLERGDKAGKLIFFDRNTGDIVRQIEIGDQSNAAKILWHPRLNQIMLGCGDGNIRVLYDPVRSRNGAIFVAGKTKKKVKTQEVIRIEQVITPHALPLFREDRHRSSSKHEQKDRKNPTRSQQPELPVGKAGSGGRVSTGGSTLSSYIIRNMGIRNKAREEENPREALLKHAKEASDNPYWVSPAYAKNQPNPIFQKPSDDAAPQAKKLKKE